jgi:pimeloyl-ACP methyl ester carboxylesterase
MKTGDRVVDWPLEHGLGTSWVTTKDGTRLRVLTAGDVRARRLLLVHGFPQNAAEWRRVLALVRDRFRVLLVDLRGFAGSDLATNGRYDLDTVVSDLVTVLETPELGGAAGPAIVCGHDWGGPIVWELCTQRPDLVQHHVSVNGPHWGAYLLELKSSSVQRKRSWYVGLFQIPGIEHVLSSQGAGFFAWMFRSSSPNDLFTSEDLEIYLAPLRDPKRLRAGLSYYRQARGRLAKLRGGDLGPPVRVPTTIVWGERDPVMRKTMPDTMREHFCPGAEILRLPGVSHWVPEERPDAVAQAILAGAGAA